MPSLRCDKATVFLFQSHKLEETLPDPKAPVGEVKHTPLKVYTDISLVADTLTSPAYELTKDKDNADIWWLYSHLRDYR